MECFITWQLEPENSGLFGRKPIINSLLNKTNKPKKKIEERKLTDQETELGSKTEQRLHAYAWKSTHRRPRICVVDQQAHIPSHVYTASNMTLTSPSFTHPRICVESTQQATSQDPRIGVEVHAYAWKAHTSHDPESRLANPKCDQDSSKPKSATHRRRSPRICVGSQ
ncbi:hypothetical protein PIB30_090381 [Stylosanthes scabra]|uniref:Uncharacterized protein n=1 Tax=Stylosanthes scabra TaxID=79078 RepID=A0ABU6SUQ2_9FABA|nr:hypothetical protein [Stylosanthes scabra]